MVFIDESFKGIYVMGAVVGPRQDVEDTIRIARAFIRKHNKNNHKKINLPEIKDSEIHRKFPDIKKMVLENLATIKSMKNKPRENVKIYSVYLPGEEIEGITDTIAYKLLAIELIKRIIPAGKEEEINITFDVFFDQYGEVIFREKLYGEILNMFPDKKINLCHVSSAQDKAIQTADVITGSIRRYLTGEDRESLKVFREMLTVMDPIKIK